MAFDKSITVKEEKNNILIHNIDYDNIYLPFRKTLVDFKDEDLYRKFITNIEKLVRSSKRYKQYLAHLHNTVGINKCSYFGNIGDEDADIEFHHGPIFNLFNYCDIVTRSILESENSTGVVSFEIADIVMDLHEKDLVSLIPLSESVHKAVHNNKKISSKKTMNPLLVDIRSSYGNFFEFINRYKHSLTSQEINQIFYYFRKISDTDSKNIDYFEKCIQIFKENNNK